ncbi:hypothetical protein ILYODFUR_030646 [Ilyodon furcidens]|uniref:Uncharacterized protein n=1 Tax=Ilyodon furcidens TaxID=33524 RepID=A0ABV0ULX5_9TELE
MDNPGCKSCLVIGLLCSLRTVMTCAPPVLAWSISGRPFLIIPALTAAFCPEWCGWPSCSRWSSLVIGQSLPTRVYCRRARRQLQNGQLHRAVDILEEAKTFGQEGVVHKGGAIVIRAGPDEDFPSASPSGWLPLLSWM